MSENAVTIGLCALFFAVGAYVHYFAPCGWYAGAELRSVPFRCVQESAGRAP